MTRPAFLFVIVLLSPLHSLGQQTKTAATCSATERVVLATEHQLWSAWSNRDAAKWGKLVDESLVSTDDGGLRKSKQEILAGIKQPEGHIHNETDETPKDSRVVFTNGIAILNFTKHWVDYDKTAGISFGSTSADTRVFACKSGEWKLIVYQETNIPNQNRRPSVNPVDHLDDYVGHYRLGENGEKGEISVVRKGNQLLETWPDEKPVEILPGKYDTFFTRGDDWVERFVRDKSGKVTGILYTYIDGEIEAKRMP